MADYDVIIIGGGPAGMSALIWCHSLDLSAVLFEETDELGGQMLQMFHQVFDYPGLIAANGRELRDHFAEQLNELGLDYRPGCKIEQVNLRERQLLCDQQLLSGRAMIIATGARRQRLNVPGEDEFETRGVSFSGTRDHSRYAGKKVCVIGGGDSAFQNSLILARICPHVTLIHRSEQFRARSGWVEQALENPAISMVTRATVKAIEGGERVERLMIEDSTTGETRAIEAEAVIIKIGMIPNTEAFAGQLELSEAGYLKVDQRQRTSLEMVYAIGDVRRPVCLSVATAVGDGAMAAKDVATVLLQKRIDQ
ncbi:MAG TPA: FAD-dependent oxidoreductase [Blastocatellia bacterium]|nr:FAD-dependent oxidoreductase [Blastocatellia bacterium]